MGREPRSRRRPAPSRRGAPEVLPGQHEVTGQTAELLRDLDVDEGWVLLLDGVPSSYVDLADPTHLGFEYMAWIAGVLDSLAPAGDPLDTVHVGGGAGSLARYLAATRPRSTQVVLELDPRIVELARDVLGLRQGPRLRVRARDGRAGLAKEPPGSADVVIRDAFDGLQVPSHLLTTGFLAEVRRVLRPGGTYVANLSGRPGLADARREAATALASFAHVALQSEPAVFRGRRNGNVVLVASDAPLPVDALLRRASGGAAPARVLVEERLAELVGRALPLEDPPDESVPLDDEPGVPGVVDPGDEVG
ncbi:methyltransferase family protein [Motilibacter rhizosphaerae]|uniref:Methyltransferase family protein n=1 Tax=Motilibacter rhizosphaerae TaxID=598652 RepID=A0A4Q7NP49_9ACTN|nr:fused MFS/spermidine synthase [Motilibacter rhizosphaerae]RZS86798.1 methyltransferase family protein [Motilibacter rhizosphaerae]